MRGRESGAQKLAVQVQADHHLASYCGLPSLSLCYYTRHTHTHTNTPSSRLSYPLADKVGGGAKFGLTHMNEQFLN